MQSFDVAYFQPVKHYHRKTIDRTVRLSATKFPLVKFFSAFKHIRAQTFKRETIISIFEQIEIHPLNTEKVIESLRVKQKAVVRIQIQFNPAPSLLSSFISEIEYTTPEKVADIEISGIYIHEFII
jgi:hypothetical protein